MYICLLDTLPRGMEYGDCYQKQQFNTIFCLKQHRHLGLLLNRHFVQKYISLALPAPIKTIRQLMSTVQNQGFKGGVGVFRVVICKICKKIMLTKDKLGTFIV
mgnify:FL=1